MTISNQFRILLVVSWVWIAIIMGVVSKWTLRPWMVMTLEAIILSTLFMSTLYYFLLRKSE